MEIKRINKYIAENTSFSRREADKLIEDKRVKINGRTAVNGDKVSAEDKIYIDDKIIKIKNKNKVYIALNKPVGIVCTTDKRSKNNIADYMNFSERIFTIGRLDKDSEGLILLTNDGDIVNPILRAKYSHEKEYIVHTKYKITDDFLYKMGNGVRILGTITKKCKVRKIDDKCFGIILTQGLNRQIRRMCEALGNEVSALKRIRIMNISLGNLETGTYRHLSHKELAQLKSLLEINKDSYEIDEEDEETDEINLDKDEITKLRQEAIKGKKAILGPYLSLRDEK